jgi:lipopolysaccharide transport system permease protein
MAWRLFVHGLEARHRQSRLGYLWLLLPALASTLTWVYLAHKRILHLRETAVPYALYVLAGTLLWQLFTDALTAPLQRLSAARSVLTKARVPHESWILAGVFDAGFSFVIRLGLLAVGMAVAGTSGGWGLLLAPLGALAVVVLGLAIGLVLTPVGLLYPDIERGLAIVIALSFFLTPVIYPPPHTFLIRFNPVTPVLVTTRSWLIGGTGVPGELAVVFAASFLVLGAAWLVYRLAQPHLVVHL